MNTETTAEPTLEPTFTDLNLPAPLLAAISELGYETPSPIQARIIPHLLAGCDVLGQAQTGTGKTAAFALPLLARIDTSRPQAQVLVLAPTRELAQQVAEAFTRYGTHLPGLRVLAVYGGQGFGEQLKALRRGTQVVVGTPGRIMDHMRRGTLDLSGLSALVLDEADEMLRMGFIDDVEWILSESPPTRQLALFSATMPAPIKRIAQKHLKDPQEVSIKVRTTTAETIRQRYWRVGGVTKREALARILETTPHEGVLVFVRTKIETQQIADYLCAQGHAAAPLSGDIAQAQREQTVNRLKSGQLDLVVATDVAARGLDVERISHVINYDIPYDTEAYVHRIGRTGRAGRSGEAILFVAPRETRMLQAIERATRQRIEEMPLPGVDAVNARRIERFRARLDAVFADTGNADTLALYQRVLEEYQEQHALAPQAIGAALTLLLHGGEPLLLRPDRELPRPKKIRADEPFSGSEQDSERRPPRSRNPEPSAQWTGAEPELESYRVEVGNALGIKAGNLVGAIANEASIDSKFIGRIKIHDDYSTVDLPVGMPREILELLKRVRVGGQPLNISRLAGTATRNSSPRAPREVAADGTARTFRPKVDVAPPPPGDTRPVARPSDRPKAGGKPQFDSQSRFDGKPKPAGKTAFAGKTKTAGKAKVAGKAKPKTRVAATPKFSNTTGKISLAAPRKRKPDSDGPSPSDDN